MMPASPAVVGQRLAELERLIHRRRGCGDFDTCHGPTGFRAYVLYTSPEAAASCISLGGLTFLSRDTSLADE